MTSRDVTMAHTATSSETAPPNAPKRHRRRRLELVVLVMVLLMIAPGVSYARALTAPGYASWQVRSVEWVRDNGGSGLVDVVENWWYTRHAPSNAAPPAAALPGRGIRRQVGSTRIPRGVVPGLADPAVPAPRAIAPLAGVTALPGEGKWIVKETGKAGAPVLYSTFLRPDPTHASVVAGAAWVPAGATSAHLVPGTRQPQGWGGAAAIPRADRPSLVATFNSGWKFTHIDGGFYLNGRQSPPLRDGRASVVIDAHGRVTVGQWGRDVSMGPNVVAVRQNLHLIVDNGAPVKGLTSNGGGLWGSAENQLQYTWRSGLGIDAAGDLIYVAGDQMTLQTLATAMTEAGIRRGMELDIHPHMVNFAIWSHRAGGHATATNLLPKMPSSSTRYLAADQRDFFYLTLNPSSGPVRN